MHHDHHVEQLSIFELFSISVPPCEMGKWRIQPEQVEKNTYKLKNQTCTHGVPKRIYLKSSTSPISPILPFLPFSNGSSLSCAHKYNCQLKFVTD